MHELSSHSERIEEIRSLEGDSSIEEDDRMVDPMPEGYEDEVDSYTGLKDEMLAT